ncbi:hypothetical protein IQ251_17430 [Saccharopolyspora sp. HNM0983]|uniref:Uncharacterized protein n=1 Tax=Saccharopolyspora montiporae TaxID=2781240 RepID=A0A929BAE5_9PSEU|nr:hypothetical protein [Saccharopolyspora sp. HNM0983]
MTSYCIDDEVGRAAWVRRSTIRDAACLTLVRAQDPVQVATAFGGMAEPARNLDIEEFCEEAFAAQERYPMIALRRLGDRVLVVEDGGRQGSRPEVLRRAAHQDAVSVYWAEDGATRFSHAVGGSVRTSFEGALPEYREGEQPEEVERFFDDLVWCRDDPVPAMLALAGRITGVPSEPGWLDGQFCTYPVAEWPDDLAAVPDPLDNVPGYPSELAAVIRAAPDPVRRHAAAAVARYVLTAAGCLDHPRVRRTLSAISAGTPVHQGRLSAVVRKWSWQSLKHRPSSSVRNQVRAMRVLRHATNGDALTGLLTALSEARRVRHVDGAELNCVALSALGAGFRGLSGSDPGAASGPAQ